MGLHMSISTAGTAKKLLSSEEKLKEQYVQFRISEVVTTLYKLAWDTTCSSYLELLKPAKGETISKRSVGEAIENFKRLLLHLHPIIPFITEELHSRFSVEGELLSHLILEEDPALALKGDVTGDWVLALVTEVRQARNSQGLPPSLPAQLYIPEAKDLQLTEWLPQLKRLAVAEAVVIGESPSGASRKIVLGNNTVHIILEAPVDVEGEKKRINEEIAYQKGFLNSVVKKLSNERFVQNADPLVVEKERQKQKDAQLKIEVLQASLDQL